MGNTEIATYICRTCVFAQTQETVQWEIGKGELFGDIFPELVHFCKYALCTYLGSFQASWNSCLSQPQALKSPSVQSPTIRIWMLKKSSSGAEVSVKGCHSSLDTLGHLTKMYCPTSILNPFFFICSSMVLKGWVTTYGTKRVSGNYTFPKYLPFQCPHGQKAELRCPTHIPSSGPTRHFLEQMHLSWRLALSWSPRPANSQTSSRPPHSL